MAGNLRALLLTPTFPPARGGIELLMERLVEHLPDIDTHVLALGVPGSEAYDRSRPFPVSRVGTHGERNRLAVTKLNIRAVREGLRLRPDVVISGHVVTAPASIALGRVLRSPTLQYLHADEVRWRPALTRAAVRRSDAVIAVSGHAAGLARVAGAQAHRLHVVHPGVDPPRADPVEKAERPTLVTVARLVDRYKGHDVMMRAMPLIRERVPEAEWVVVGGGRLREELEQLARAQGVADAVRFVGVIGDRERDDWLARAHVFVLISRLPPEGIGGEGFGIVFLEAAAHGLPVVAGGVGGALDAVADGKTGVLVDPTDPAQVASAIADLLLDRARAAQLGRAGADWAREFSWRRHAGAVEAVLREHVDSRRKGSHDR